jgi:hypothetical protein
MDSHCSKPEENIALLAESAEEGGLTYEIEQALAVYFNSRCVGKARPGGGIHLVLYCEGMAKLAKSEVQRLEARQKHFESTAERVSLEWPASR